MRLGWLSRVLGVAVLTTAAFAAAVPVAAAHVTVHSDEPVRGASDAALIFRTPNEDSHAVTVSLAVFFPKATPVLDVLIDPRPGWTATARTGALPHPVTTDDGPVNRAVTSVRWTANARAQGLQPGQAADFVVTAGRLPDAPSLTFRVLQRYSNGDVARWIETAAPGADAPEHPAPVLRLAAAGAPPTAAATGAGTTGSSGGAGNGTDRGLAIAAIAVAAMALGVSLRAGRRS